MHASNPVLIQDVPRSPSVQPPLFLVHDASGTIFSYFQLGALGRKVYGIYDPRFEQSGGGGWQSVVEMARMYIRLIKKVMLRGDIVLGGWSFGGILAVQIAHMLAMENKRLRVSGIILVDSIYSSTPKRVLDMDSQGPMMPGVTQDVKEKVLTSLIRATCLCDEWQPPAWNTTDAKFHGKNVPIPPPVVLVRAKSLVPMVNPNEMCLLDKTRSMPYLGWEDAYEDFIIKVLETCGDHYSIFDTPNTFISNKSKEVEAKERKELLEDKHLLYLLWHNK
ncbi:thioesterase [Bipolaris maydis]|uniref:thioesterase n=1 Tax=Cochliobolus heterostrophus TaxID=5016 RepID=UPI0024D673C1|nr:thioesterase [Bipolaris maydis]